MPGQHDGNKAEFNIRNMAAVALMAAVLCVVAPLSLPFGPIPVTLGVLVIFLSIYAVGPGRAAAATGLYLLLGCAGLPVFSGFSAGFSKLVGPTGGYLIGYIPMAWTAGVLVKRGWSSSSRTAPVIQLAGLLLGLSVLYALGTARFLQYMNSPILMGEKAGGMTLPKALGICVWPFLPFDILKAVLAVLIGGPLRRRLQRAGLLQ